MKQYFAVGLLMAVVATPSAVMAQGNLKIESFHHAKRTLETEVYFDHRETFYCRARFDARKNITLPEGFVTPQHQKRAHRVEWEHVVPAENFGRSFIEWREGDPACVNGSGRPFKGRKCAEKTSKTFRYMQADMYNLYPAIGAVNAIRSNYRYAMMPEAQATFGTCEMKVGKKRAEPPTYTRGAIARTTFYMADSYPQYRISAAQQKLMQVWDKQQPVTEWECQRAARIEALQGNENKFVAEPCRRLGLYHK